MAEVMCSRCGLELSIVHTNFNYVWVRTDHVCNPKEGMKRRPQNMLKESVDGVE